MSNFYKFLCDVVSPAIDNLYCWYPDAPRQVPLYAVVIVSWLPHTNGPLDVFADLDLWSHVSVPLYERKAA